MYNLIKLLDKVVELVDSNILTSPRQDGYKPNFLERLFSGGGR